MADEKDNETPATEADKKTEQPAEQQAEKQAAADNPDYQEIKSEHENPEAGIGEPKDVEAIYDIPVQISAVLGRSSMKVSQLLKLGRGAVVELDRKVGEAIDIYVNNRLVARGEVVVVEDRLGVTMTEIVKSDRSS
ncbi:MAG: flagellar motor switch protein FliN [Pseudomonadota bacterium]